MKQLVLSIAVATLISGCSTVTVRDQGTTKISSSPSHSSMKHFFLWGIVGHSHVNVTEVCGPKPPVQVQTERSFLDGFLSVITLGLYYPRHAYVWCNEDGGA